MTHVKKTAIGPNDGKKDCKVNGNYVLRGHNRELALKNGLPVSYDRLALLAVSIYHLAHWRHDVTAANYLLAV